MRRLGRHGRPERRHSSELGGSSRGRWSARPRPIGAALSSRGAAREPSTRPSGDRAVRASEMTLFLAGDVMCVRGIDQILPHPSRRAGRAGQRSDPAAQDFAYVWGDALAELKRRRPQVRIVNLETAVTTSEDAWPDKHLHYRMHPANVPALTAARIDCCTLDQQSRAGLGYRGPAETLDTLHEPGSGQREPAALGPRRRRRLPSR